MGYRDNGYITRKLIGVWQMRYFEDGLVLALKPKSDPPRFYVYRTEGKDTFRFAEPGVMDVFKTEHEAMERVREIRRNVAKRKASKKS